MKNRESWNPESWKSKIANQLPTYRDNSEAEEVIKGLKDLPSIVFPGEIDCLKEKIARAARGELFILQGGDCVERFADCNESAIMNKIKIILQMSVIINYLTKTPVLKVGRIAGQYAKPRSKEFETVEGKEVYSYKGDNINGYDPVDRVPSASRMREGYFYASATLNYIRAMISGGFADLHHPDYWDLDFVEKADKNERYKGIINQVRDAVDFLESFGSVAGETLRSIDFYTSHEGLLLPFEAAMTRVCRQNERYYNTSSHLLWIGERTRELDGAHVEYFRGIENPIGIKLSSKADPEELIKLISRLNPANEEGKICLITRMGAALVEGALPAMVKQVVDSGQKVTWLCDPMHGNTVTAANNIKTRHFNDILKELELTFKIQSDCGSRLSGVHFELTGEHVTECLGGSGPETDSELNKNYQSFCDPRLNYNQSMEMSFLISDLLNKLKR